jgi:hypothetical protein
MAALTAAKRREVMARFMSDESASRTPILGGKAALQGIVNGLDGAMGGFLQDTGHGQLAEAQALALIRLIVDKRLGG